MNPTATFAISTLAATSVAVAVTLLLSPDAASTDTTTVAELRTSIDGLRADQQRLQQRLDTIASAPAPATATTPAGDRTAATTVSPEQVAAAVEAYLGRRAAAGGPAGAADAAAGKPAFDLETDFAALVGNSYWENADAWKKAFAAGRIDDVIAKFEAIAKANPQDTKAQMDLANAYLAHLQLDQTKWQRSMDADRVFDRVLDLDETHWEARFTKAMSYTFWPDFLGKKKEAISHFETLVQQQESMPPQDHEAQTYLYLGNLLETRDPAKAKEMWQKGARRHPNNQELQKRAGG